MEIIYHVLGHFLRIPFSSRTICRTYFCLGRGTDLRQSFWDKRAGGRGLGTVADQSTSYFFAVTLDCVVNRVAEAESAHSSASRVTLTGSEIP